MIARARRGIRHLGAPVAVRVGDPAPAVLDDLLAAVPGAVGFASADEMPRSEAPRPDGVVVATPSAFHPATAIAAARSGRAVLCEKPLAMDLAEAESMLAAAASSGVLVDLGSCDGTILFDLLRPTPSRCGTRGSSSPARAPTRGTSCSTSRPAPEPSCSSPRPTGRSCTSPGGARPARTGPSTPARS